MRTAVLVTLAATMLFTGVASAALETRVSEDFANNALGVGLSGSYEANVLPAASSPAFIKTSASTTSETIADGILTANSSASDNSKLYYASYGGTNPDFFGNDVSNSIGYTVEFRAKVKTALTDRIAFRINAMDGVRQTAIVLYGDKIGYVSAAVQTQSLDTMSDYITIRMAVSPGFMLEGFPSQTATIWVDDQLIWQDVYNRSYAAKGLMFGDPNAGGGATDVRGAVDIDYIRWDTTGAYAPIPEPATMAILAVGGVVALVRRNRK